MSVMLTARAIGGKGVVKMKNKVYLVPTVLMITWLVHTSANP